MQHLFRCYKSTGRKKIYLFGILRKIYTGFNGPATGAYHEKTKDDFIRIITTYIFLLFDYRFFLLIKKTTCKFQKNA